MDEILLRQFIRKKFKISCLFDCSCALQNGTYGFRIVLIYDDETSDKHQKSGSRTKKEANGQKNIIIAQIHNNNFVIYHNIKVKDYFIYWLEEGTKNKEKINYNNYMSYRNII